MPVDKFPLPEYRHLPGTNRRPASTFLESVAELATSITKDHDANENIAWQYGIRLINAGYFWEAHEVLEAVWMRAPQNSRERFLVQCLIQIANAALKQTLKQSNAAERLCVLAEGCLRRAFPVGTTRLMGFTTVQLQEAIRQCRDFTGKIQITPEQS